MLFIVVLPISEPAHALSWQDLWLTPDQQAQRLLEEGSAADAAQLFEDQRWRAVANFRAGDYGNSAAGFGELDDSESLYNLGNALAKMGEFEAAIAAYDEVIDADPDNEDALYNRDLLQDMLEQQQDSQSGDQGNQENASDSGGGAQQSEGASQSDQAGQEDLEAMQQELERAAQEAQQQAAEAQEQQGVTQEEAEAMRRAQEQQQAMEQWLRRIPDDPGGLLRRKFRYQYQRQGRDQDGNNLWPDDEVQPW
jgi:Ca-activated chloride channel family protein